ncbi:hypothetical protein OS493_018556 [Desmophyllum pertusum]|uniref:Uncharacterized protein n=1 Tax=Desmophyllum pertusum TaxID=174260 RepID=A0A9X0A1S3_9CNID|nr:hypothetical protein OS493_018556 [Desmophyllum pertusum]
MARAAHTDRPEGASMMEQPFRKGSVLDDFSCIVKDPSVVKLMSEWDRCTSELKEVEDGDPKGGRQELWGIAPSTGWNDLSEDQAWSSASSSVSLSGGKEHSMRLESISIPRNTSRVVGPSSLSGAKGMPRRTSFIVCEAAKVWHGNQKVHFKNNVTQKLKLEELVSRLEKSCKITQIGFGRDKASQLYDTMVQLRSLREQNGHRGKHTEDVGQRQQQRHLKEIREKAQTALWFAETYGLVPKSLNLEDSTGQQINVTFQDRNFNTENILSSDERRDMSSEQNRSTGQPNEPYHNLDEEEKEKLKNNNGTPVQNIKVKISGDGTRMSHSSNVFVCSFAIVEDGQDYLSSSGNHTIAIIKGKEEYQTLKASLANVIRDVNATIQEGHLVVDGQKVNLEFYLGGDYKFLLLAMGMKAATSNNSCIWCKIYKNDRCNMSHNCTHFQSAELMRIVEASWSKQPGCHAEPLFTIPVNNAVLDELHLMLRDDSYNKPGRQKSEDHLQEFLAAVRSLGVSLRVYWVADKLEWTSLLGGEKRMLLRKLPDLFEKFLPPERVEITRRLWINFRVLLDILNKDNLSDDDITEFEAKAQSWGKQMVNISGSGVEKKNDDLRRYFHRKINRWDAATNLVLVEKRQEKLREKERPKRPYEKRDSTYWIEGGKQEAAKKVPRISTSAPPAAPMPTAPMPTAMSESI